MTAVVVSKAAVVEQTLALSALHGSLNGPETPVLSTDRSEALMALLPPLAATLALSIGPAVEGWESDADTITLQLRHDHTAPTSMIAASVTRWLARMLAAQVWASAAPALARVAADEAAVIGESLAAGLRQEAYPPSVKAYDC